MNLVVRMLMGGHVTASLVERLPVPPWTGSATDRLIARLARQLSEAASPRPGTAGRLQALVARLYGLDNSREWRQVDDCIRSDS